MKQFQFNKINMSRLGGFFRRGTAFALAMSMMFSVMSGTVSAKAAVAASPIKPIQDSNYPNVEIEGNFVRNEFGFLTGYFELSLRVQLPTTGTKSFRSLSTTLEYDATHLTPVEWASDAAGNDKEIQVTGSNYYSKDLQAQPNEKVDTAVALGGMPTPVNNTQIEVGENGSKRGLMTFTARARTVGVKFDDMTTIATVRFKIHDDVAYSTNNGGAAENFMDHFSISKVNGDYKVHYDGTAVNNTDTLQAEMGTGSSLLMNLASDADTARSVSNIRYVLDYMLWDDNGADYYEYYYIPEYDPNNSNTYTQVTETIDGKSYTLDKPVTDNKLILAQNPNIDESQNTTLTGTSGKYSYISNLIVNDPVTAGNLSDGYTHINFPVVSKLSAMAGESTLDKLTTIVYVDWDNTLLGTQIVPKNTDIRGLVSDYVAENFIYHDTDDTTYGANDLNDPAQRAAADSVTTEDVVSSLERKYNYRGKYPAGGPQPDGTTDTTTVDSMNGTPKGAEYPLTNKLDYVFYKRPMTHVVAKPTPDDKDGNGDPKYPQGATDSQYIIDLADWEQNHANDWVQESTTSNGGGNGSTPAVVASYDVDHPYAYGWAKCTAENYEDVWTTLGMGELSSYSGASSGGYQAQTAPATVTYDGDYAFEFADLKTGFAADESTVFLKAVYEPGVDLYEATFTYRMIHEPYYNKLNGSAAAEGGAYSVDIVYERSHSEHDGTVHGVARTRDLIIQQDSTTDLYWENGDLSGNLSNATLNEADLTKTKTTYVPITVDNGDEIEFSLTLSARFNRVDYYLVEKYNSNFVNASWRSDGNPAKRPAKDAQGNYDYSEYVLENYNYNTADSVTDDEYYDVLTYEEKEGSFGFVLTGTLNNLMQYATLGGTDIYTYITYSAMQDANIRKGDGSIVTNTDQTAMRNTLIALATDIVNNHQNDPDYWNAEKGWAELSYHQVQLYITTGTLYSRAAADAVPIQWCNLHASCAANRSGKPTTWKELIEAAREANGGNDSKIKSFSNVAELENLSHLRKDVDGNAYSTLSDMITAITGAVAALDNGATVTTIYSWDQIQDYIIRQNTSQTSAETESRSKYWWYDGSTSTSITDWAGLLTAGEAAIAGSNAPKAPGETTAVARTSKLAVLEKAYDDNKAKFTASEYDTDSAWVSATENLAIITNGKEGYYFNSFNDFVTQFTTALTQANTDSYSTPDWYQIQYLILNGGSTPAPEGAAGAPADYAGYWWHNGGVKIVDLKTMLKAAADNSTAWQNFALSDLQALTGTNAPADFRAAFDGTAIDSINFATFKANIEAYVAGNSGWSSVTDMATLWDQVQYTVIHGTVSAPDASKEKGYYWWKDGGTASAVPVTDVTGSDAATDSDNLAKALLDAAFRKKYNGNTVAYDNITATILEYGRLVDEVNAGAAAYPADFTSATLSAVQTAVENIVNGMSLNDYKTYVENVTANGTWGTEWNNIQNALLAASGSFYAGDYWWKENNAQGADPSSTWSTLLGKIDSFLQNDGTVSESDLQSYFTPAMAEELGMTPDGSSEFVNDYGITDFTDITWVDIRNAGYSTLTWHQVQCLLIMHYCEGNTVADSILSPGDAENYVENGYGITPPTFVSGSMLAILEIPKLEIAVPADSTTTTETSEDGLTVTTTTTTETYNAETQFTDKEIKSQVVTKVVGDKTTTIIMVTTITTVTLNPETRQPITTVTTETSREVVPNEEPTEPTESTTPEGIESPEPVESATPEETESPEPTETTEPEETETPDSTETTEPEETESPEPVESATPEVSESPEPTETTEPEVTESPEPTETTEPEETETPDSAETTEPEETESPEPAESATPEESESPGDMAEEPEEEAVGETVTRLRVSNGRASTQSLLTSIPEMLRNRWLLGEIPPILEQKEDDAPMAVQQNMVTYAYRNGGRQSFLRGSPPLPNSPNILPILSQTSWNNGRITV